MLRSLLIFVVSSFGAGLIRPLFMICLIIYGGEYLVDESTDGRKSIIRSITNQLPESIGGVVNQVARGEKAYDFSDETSEQKIAKQVNSSGNNVAPAYNYQERKQAEVKYKQAPPANFTGNVVDYYNKLSGDKYEISDSLGYELYNDNDRNYALKQGFSDSKRAADYILSNNIVGRKFFNREGLLPRNGNYFEYDLYKLTNQSEDRGTHRIVIDLNSSTAMYTPDHYKTFIPIK